MKTPARSSAVIGRRRILTTLGVAGVATAFRPFAALGQVPANRPVIAFLVPQTKESFADNVNAFTAGLKDLGYVDGQNVTVEYRYADAVLDRQPALAAELVKLGPAVFVTGAASAMRSAEATNAIPIVVGNFAPGSGSLNTLVGPNLGHPLVANVTGVINTDVGPKQQLALAKELLTSVTQIGFMLGTDTNDGGASSKASAEAGAAAAGVKIVYAEGKTADDVEPAFRSLVAQRLPVIVFSNAALWQTTAAKHIALAAEARIPCVYNSRPLVVAGGLVAASGDSSAGFRRAAAFVDRILKGAKPSDLPVEQLEVQLLTVNLKTAQTLGLTIPAPVLARATEKIG